MPNDEALGPRKTMFVLVTVGACFAVLWPKILSPMIVGPSRDHLQPNQFDREAGCCDVMFQSEIAVLELINEVCSQAVHINGKLSPHAAIECRKSVNETCGVDIAAFLKRTENIGKSSRILVEMLKNSNSSCLKEHFGVPLWNVGPHPIINSWTQPNMLKQERPAVRAGPHPAFRERGRAIPAGTPAPQRAPQPAPQPLPPHVRVKTSPLAVYYEPEVKPPPIPGMRPPLGSPGGPVPAPKSSMGFIMPIYTICIIMFFVYTLSKIIFKRASIPYEEITPDPEFRRRVFRNDSRTSPDKFVVTAISGLVAEVRQQMEESSAQQHRQENQDNQSRPYSNGTVLHTGPVRIVASEYESEERSPECLETVETKDKKVDLENLPKESSPENELEELEKPIVGVEKVDEISERKEGIENIIKEIDEAIDINNSEIDADNDVQKNGHVLTNETEDILNDESKEIDDISNEELRNDWVNEELRKDLVNEESNEIDDEPIETVDKSEQERTKELLEEAIEENTDDKEEKDEEPENATVKVVGMEVNAQTEGSPWSPPPAAPPAPHEAEEVKAIYLDTDIPQKSRVLVADFGDKPAPKHSSSVVSGKMTLSLIQDAPRDTPDRDLESTVDDYTTASGVTQPAAEEEELSDVEIEEEIEIEEIEEEVEDEEEPEQEDQKTARK